MRQHRHWDTPALDRPPVAAATGPFARRPFLELVSNRHTTLIEDGEALLCLDLAPGSIAFAGHRDLTDYHSPLGSGIEQLVAELVETAAPGTVVDLDSLPLEASEPVIKGLEMAGLSPVAVVEDVCAVVTLPSSFDEYLDMIGKKQRHELRRKRRRYEETMGEVVFETHPPEGWAFSEFVRLHRIADGDKGEFMTTEREAFFRDLHAGWRIDLLRVPGTERASACLLAYVDDDGYFLYNSSYDLALAEASPGVTLLGASIEQAIGECRPRFDFLKGDETYKFRLGAESRPLYRVTATT